MKKILYIILTASVALCSCTKSELDSPAVKDQIFFQVAEYTASTKAEPTHIANNQTFGAFAYEHTGLWNTVSDPLTAYMNNEKIVHTSTAWAPETPYFWTDSYLSFAGYAPYMASGVSYTKAGGIQFSNFTVASTPSTTAGSGNKIDLVYSDEAASKNLCAGNAYDTHNGTGLAQNYGHSGVPMLFHHALAKLNFEIKYDESSSLIKNSQKDLFNGVKVNYLKIKNIYTKGNFSSVTNAWTGQSSNITSYVTLNSTATTTAATTSGYVSNYFVMPQNIQTGDMIEIQYSILPYTTVITAKANLRTTSVTKWDPNKVYTYTIVISPITDTPIIFDPTVTDWVDGGTYPITVN